MPSYRVIWEIDIDAATPRAAAEQALQIQRDATSLATIFNVADEDGGFEQIDLAEDSAEQQKG